MSKFVLDTAGAVDMHPLSRQPGKLNWVGVTSRFEDLDAFTQGYIEALFFTENEPGTTREDRVTARGTVRKAWAEGAAEGQHKDMPGDYGFSDLAPETLERIRADCDAFKAKQVGERYTFDGVCQVFNESRHAEAGRDFWYTRNGHGCGFWDGDWPKPYATKLDENAKSFGNVDVYIGDNGKVYLG